MGDRSLVRGLKRWATEEFNLTPQSLPNDSYLKTLCVGPGASIWKYVTNNVLQQRNVRIMCGNLWWSKVLQDKEVQQAEGQSEAAKRRQLLEQIEKLKSEINHLDCQTNGKEDPLATEEQSISHTWDLVEEGQRRDLMLQAFRLRCTRGRQALSEDTHKISRQCQALEQLARKADIEVLLENEASNSSEGTHHSSTAEPQVLRDVRELCDERVLFFHALQESELKTAPSAATHMTHEQRAAVFQHWLSSVEELLHGYPPNQVLSALQYLTSRQQRELEEKLNSLDVTRDVTALRFRYEGSHLLELSGEEEDELAPVKNLLQSEVEQSLMELAHTRSRIQHLQNLLLGRKKEAELELSGLREEFHTDAMALSVFELELQCVMQAAARDLVREQCVHLDQRARDQQEALRKLRSQWQSVLDFRQLVDARQEQIRGLIKGNSTAKTELTRQHRELGQFLLGDLVPQFGEVNTAANGLRNSVSQEVKQFGTISLVGLDRRTIEGLQRIPASRLSIHRLQASSFHSLCQSLAFPLYRAPEELCSQACSLIQELRFLRQLLQLHTTSLHKVQKRQELLPASDQQALLSRVGDEEQELLRSLLPRVRKLIQHCTQGLSNCNHVKTAICHWWDQPAQLVLPEISKGGMTLQQWLQRWKIAAKASK